METAEAERRPHKALDTPVVLLDDVVEVFALPQMDGHEIEIVAIE